MREVNKLAKHGWSNAMIHQRTLSLILTLDNFLISGPHILFEDQYENMLSDPNVFIMENQVVKSSIQSELDKSVNKNMKTNARLYYLMRSFIRGILFGLNPLYQISLFVPCDDPKKMSFYKEIISKIDIGEQFFEDRIYWNEESLKRDIMDDKLACLIYANKVMPMKDDWIRNISLECKPFTDGPGINNNLFDLVEIRSFLEEMHQRYFSLILEHKNTHFVEMVRSCMSESFNSKSPENTFINGFYSTNNNHKKFKKPMRRFISERFSFKDKEFKSKNGYRVFKDREECANQLSDISTKLRIQEYENIILEQERINYQISRVDLTNEVFSKCLKRWNIITFRKSEILRALLNQKDSSWINEKLKLFNFIYYQRKYQDERPDSEWSPSLSEDSNFSELSDSNSYLVISDSHDTKPVKQCDPQCRLFTTWYVD